MSALSGRSVVVTRPAAQAGPLVSLLEAAGADVIEIPAFRIEAFPCPEFTAALLDVAGKQGALLILTSVNAVTRVEAALAETGLTAEALSGTLVAAVGPATEAAINDLGLEVGIRAEPHTGKALAEAVVSALRGPDGTGAEGGWSRPALFPTTPLAADTIERVLGAAGIEVERFDVYGAVAGEGPVALQRTPDVVTFASPSAARFFEAVIEPGAVESVKRNSVAACIGPSTAKAVAAAGYAGSITATVHTIDGLVDAIIEHFS